MTTKLSVQITGPERFNVLTSLPGALAAPIGLALLLAAALQQGDPWRIVSFTVYGTTLVLLYTIATLYHAQRGKAKMVLRELDHYAIYLLIAGTYTPFSLIPLRGRWGWPLFALVWVLAVVGILVEVRPHMVRRNLPLAIYFGMGWLILAVLRPLLQVYPWQGVAWLGGGGAFYTGGIVFYGLDRRFGWAHGAWHICVLAGSLCHYLAIYLYIALR
ncbi:MAG TPA: hemolysin III family protein [Geobacteraceae bacterium]